MASKTSKARCVICNKENSSLRCEGCFQTYCYNHITDHRQELNGQFDQIEATRDLFRQRLTEESKQSRKYSIIEQINQWEQDSILKIKQRAEEIRKLLLKYTDQHLNTIEVELNRLTEQLQRSRQENDFIETDLNQWTEKLASMTSELNEPLTITIRNETIPLVNEISLDFSGLLQMSNYMATLMYLPNIRPNARWMSNGITVAGGHGRGDSLHQLDIPFSLCIDNDDDDDNQTIYIADYGNQRIVEWKSGATSGHVVAGGNGQGHLNNQLNNPTCVIFDKLTDSFFICDRGNKRVVQWSRRNRIHGQTIIPDIDCYGLTIDHNRYIYITDYTKHEVKRWKIGEPNGIVIAGGNGQGNQLNQLYNPTYLFLDQEQSLYIVDYNNNRVMKWINSAQQGIVVAGIPGSRVNRTQMSNPGAIVVDQSGTIYTADYSNHRIMRWSQEATQGTIVVGGNGQGKAANQLYGPWGLSFDREGNIYVVDRNNHRIQKFYIDPTSN